MSVTAIPKSFKQWVETNTQDTSDYFEYLTEFYQDKEGIVTSTNENVVDIYKNLLKSVTINYLTQEERRFLSNIDFNDSRELDIAIPLYARKLKDICKYYTNKREDVKVQNSLTTLKGTVVGIEYKLKLLILNLLSNSDFVKVYNLITPDIKNISSLLTVEIIELYDEFPDYFTQTQTENYLRDTYSIYNIGNIDPHIFINFKQALQELYNEEPKIFSFDSDVFIISKNTGLNLTIPYTDITDLNERNFLYSVKELEKISLTINQQFVQKYLGTTVYYLSTNSLGHFTSGVLVEPDNVYGNILNGITYNTATIPATGYEKSVRNIGGYFLPHKLNIPTFICLETSADLNMSSLSSDTIYVFANPNNSKTSIHRLSQTIGSLKNNSSNSLKQGTVNAQGFLKFYPYRSKIDINQTSDYGISRSSDTINFWDINKINNVWKNADIYPLNFNNYETVVDQRVADLLFTDSSITDWKMDLFGNEFGILKPTKPILTLFGQNTATFTPINSGSYTSASTQYSIPYYGTQQSSSVTQYVTASNTNPELSIYESNIAEGSIFCRNYFTSTLVPLSAALSAVFLKYSGNTVIYNQLNNSIQGFDIIEDVFIFETPSYVIVERISFDTDNLSYVSKASKLINFTTLSAVTGLEKVSNWWYNEKESEIVFAKISLAQYLSGTNYKELLPSLYTLDINSFNLVDSFTLNTYITGSDVATLSNESIFNEMEIFTLSGTRQEVNIVSISKPKLTYNSSTKVLNMTFVGTDYFDEQYFYTFYFRKNGTKFDLKQASFLRPPYTCKTINFTQFPFVSSSVTSLYTIKQSPLNADFTTSAVYNDNSLIFEENATSHYTQYLDIRPSYKTEKKFTVCFDACFQYLTSGLVYDNNTLSTTLSTTPLTGGNGFCVILYDADTLGENFLSGGVGSSLGYTNYEGVYGIDTGAVIAPGTQSGYIGVGFDFTGDFSLASGGKTTGYVDDTLRPNRIVVRGTAATNYQFISATDPLETFSRPLTLMSSVSSAFRSYKLEFDNDFESLTVSIKDTGYADYFKYGQFDISYITKPDRINVALAHSTAELLSKLEVKNISLYGSLSSITFVTL